MLLKNKINQNNAFEVPLVEIIKMKAFNQTDDEGWKRISSAVEVKTKIYGYRVDSLHNDSHTIVGGL